MLFDILTNRLAVNILKGLSESEKKKEYSTNVNELIGSRESIEVAVVLLASARFGAVFAARAFFSFEYLQDSPLSSSLMRHLTILLQFGDALLYVLLDFTS